MPDRPRVAFEGSAEARERLARALGDRAELVAPDAADVLVRDGPASLDDGVDPGLPTIVLVDAPHPELALAYVRAGASAVLARRADADELLAAVAAVDAGLVVLDGAIRDEAVPVRTPAPSPPLAEPLTERERAVLAMLADGDSNRGIAARLGISENTVKAHVAAILAKLGAASRTEAVTLGVRRGLLML